MQEVGGTIFKFVTIGETEVCVPSVRCQQKKHRVHALCLQKGPAPPDGEAGFWFTGYSATSARAHSGSCEPLPWSWNNASEQISR